ncbi:CheR family methyltransferase [Mycolicibacterium mengxianglii]|uniref:CheR family methyltransferase n=1 Tax=Mycolicibacterium mengxianglii TaxID=2736649 RepID=UPI0018EF0043|nr:CheR family methyltransferase [Mycolicibacterium mengxianglii]
MSEQTDEAFEAVLGYLRDTRGFDFTGYKRASLMRRVRHRMDQVRLESFEDYLDALQASPDEFAALFNTILINVTDFFRDPDAWEYVRTEVVPTLLAQRGPDDPVRVWSAGCASGQEPFSVAMMLAEMLSPEDFRRRVKIYATDIDDDALNDARAASYSAKAVESVPKELLHRHFDLVGTRYVLHKDLRRSVIFGRNDLVKDAPISRVDLLLCRNALMYFNAETQRNVLNRLNFALAPQGVLFLGHAEMLLSHTERFTPLNLKHRVFQRVARPSGRIERFEISPPETDRFGELTGLPHLRDLAFRASPVAQIVVSAEDTVTMINEKAETTFGLSPRDIGRLLRDLEISYRPVELRSHIEQAKLERRPARIPDVRWHRSGTDAAWYDINVNPLVSPDNRVLGVSVVFTDVSSTRTLLDKVVESNHQLETAYEELQSTNEELETTNEELQSTVEELETTNEELQSTNEELETMNEELQSTNDELQTINDTLRERTTELDEARFFMGSLVNSIRVGLVVVDRDMRVIAWNRGCEELWGLRTDETVGKLLADLDIGVPLVDVEPLIRNAFVDLDAVGTTSVTAMDRRGHTIVVQVTCSAFRGIEGAVLGALILMEPVVA